MISITAVGFGQGEGGSAYRPGMAFAADQNIQRVHEQRAFKRLEAGQPLNSHRIRDLHRICKVQIESLHNTHLMQSESSIVMARHQKLANLKASVQLL